MPGVVSVEEFAHETREDVASPTTSTFVTKIPQFRQSIACLEEVGSAQTDVGSKQEFSSYLAPVSYKK